MTTNTTAKEKRIATSIFQMQVLDYFIMANDPARYTLHKIYKMAIKYNQLDWIKSQFKSYSDVWIDFDKGLIE